MQRILVFITILILGLSSCKPKESTAEQVENLGQTERQTPQKEVNKAPEKYVKTENRADLSFLLEMKGKSPNAYNLFQNDPLKSRLEIIMGDKYIDFLERTLVTSPIQVDGEVVYITGRKEQLNDRDASAIVIDVKQNLIWVLLYENGESMNIFKDDRDVRMPDIFIRIIQEVSK